MPTCPGAVMVPSGPGTNTRSPGRSWAMSGTGVPAWNWSWEVRGGVIPAALYACWTSVIWSSSEAVLNVRHGLSAGLEAASWSLFVSSLVRDVEEVEEPCGCRGWWSQDWGPEYWTVLGDDDAPVDPVEPVGRWVAC